MSSITPGSATSAVMVSHSFWQQHGAELQKLTSSRLAIRVVPCPDDLPEVPLEAVGCAYFSVDAFTDTEFIAQLRQAPNLRWVHIFTAGADLPVCEALQEQGVAITTSSGANATPVAHSVLAAILGFNRRMPRFFAEKAERQWRPLLGAAAPEALEATTATIVGMGPIGQETARLCQAFGMHTIGVRRSATPAPHCHETIAFGQLHEVLPRTDWLVLVCPLTPQTDQWINADAMALLPHHAHLINVSRGRVVVEADLIHALRTQVIAGAYCDVFETEPLPADSPLWDLPNLVLSPHSAGLSQAFSRNAAHAFLDNLQRWLDHQPLHNLAPEGKAT